MTDNNTFILKGMSRKAKTITGKDNQNKDGEYESTTATSREKFVSTLATVSADGKLDLLADPKAVGDFISKYANDIADVILDRNSPTYNWDPESWEWEITGRAALGLSPLPGRQKRGLFDVQKHFSIGSLRVLRKYNHVLINAEMGFGKTSTAVALAMLLGKWNLWPFLVMCPGHMVWKWKRDIEAASDPKDPITARVITRPVLSSYMKDGKIVNGPTWLIIRDEIEKLGGEVISTVRHQIYPICTNDPGGRRKVTVKCGISDKDKIAKLFQKQVLKDTKSKMTIEPKIQLTTDGLVVEYVDRDEYTLFDFVNDYKAGVLSKKAAAIVAFDPAKYDAGANIEPAVHWVTRKVQDKRTYRKHIVKLGLCPKCNCMYDQGAVPLYCENEIRDKETKTSRVCHEPLFNFNRWRRTGAAKLIRNKFKHFFKLYIADEVHKTKSGDTDIGVADQRFLSSIKYSAALTGTLFGGTASSLFYLLYRRSSEVRRLYEFSDVNRWIDHYGLWEEMWNQREPIVSGRGASTGIKRYNSRRRELPGVSPAVIRYLLPLTLFGNITDLGYELPPLYEDVVTLDMTKKQGAQYEAINSELLSIALELVKEGDPGGLSVWFNQIRYRPASAFRDEEINYHGKKGGVIELKIPAVISAEEPWLPKEIKLAEIVRQNALEGRKVLAFAEQTGTRDIRARMQLAIEKLAPGGKLTLVQVGLLSADTLSPAKREAWITTRAPSLNTLIVNPKLVETGLDLVMFNTIVFYETTVSLYTLWQAMRRVWRLGQTREVDVKFLVYRNTIEEEILRRMGIKMKYAQLLYGKEAAGVLVETDGEEDVQREIIQSALEGKTHRTVSDAIKTVFGNQSERTVRISDAPTGSPIATSPIIVKAIELPSGITTQLTLFPGFEQVKIVHRRGKKRTETPSSQTAFTGW